MQRNLSPKFRLIRKTSDSCIAALKDDLLTSNWDNVTNEEDVNMAYNHFIERFQTSYEKCCPVKKVRVDVINGCIKLRGYVTHAERKIVSTKSFYKTELILRK